MNRVELLAPAGDLERLKVTLLYGADAVYFGGKEYSLRANANNFSVEEIRDACDFAHNLNKRVYLALNIVFHNEDLKGLEDYIKETANAGVDAFIVSDPFIISYLRKNYPDIEVHLSTQNSTTNTCGIQFIQKEGVERVVLARELSIKEIKEIIDKTGMDIEIFIHGAMCSFYSGRCSLSNYLNNRDSNRGGCSQVCRFAFNMGCDEEKFTMATKDLNTASVLKELIEIGIRSFKIEGRMRSLYYLATVVSSYRKLIDAYYDNKLDDDLINEQEKILARVANRETSTHYLNHEADESDQYFTGRQEQSNQDFLAMVLSYDAKNKMMMLTERNYFKLGDEVELFSPSGKVYSFTIKKMYNAKMEECDVARHAEEIIYIPFDEVIKDYSMMRIKAR